jgi:hypothetical protein
MKPLFCIFILLLSLHNSAFARRGGDVSGGGDSVELEVEKLLSAMAKQLMNQRHILQEEFALDAVYLATIAVDATVINIKPEDLTLYDADFFLMGREGKLRTVYAKHYRLPEKVIFINHSLWQEIQTQQEKEYIIFHELLGLGAVEINAYKKGNSIYARLLELEGFNKSVMKSILQKVGDLFSSSKVKDFEQRQLAIAQNEAAYRLEKERAFYMFQMKIENLEDAIQAIESQISTLEIRRSRIHECIEKLNSKEASAYFRYQQGERSRELSLVNNKIEACLDQR